MSPIRWRMTAIIVLVVITTTGTLFFAQKTYEKLNSTQSSVKQSLQLQMILQGLKATDYSDDRFKELQSIRASIEPKGRQNALSAVIQSYSARSPRLFVMRVKDFTDSEILYRQSLDRIANDLNRNLQLTILILLVSNLGGLLTLHFFANTRIFRPLKRLSTQMLDFLNGHYSYQFKVPAPDEMGDLQATFNSMAQRVLHNMEELKALDSAKSDFLNIASHELRTPMTSIKGSLGLITSGIMGNMEGEVLNLMQIAETETDRLIRLTNDILDMAKIEARRLPLKQEWFLMDDLVDQTVKGLHGLSEASKVNIKVDGSYKVMTFADRDRIQQVLTNLLSNALKFSPAGSTVTISTVVNDQGYLQIEVSDQGRGISPEDQARIFQKFRQATNSESPLVKGTGLGLAIAKALIEEHQGTIGVRSMSGRGSTFFFSLPQWRAYSAPALEPVQKGAA